MTPGDPEKIRGTGEEDGERPRERVERHWCHRKQVKDLVWFKYGGLGRVERWSRREMDHLSKNKYPESSLPWMGPFGESRDRVNRDKRYTKSIDSKCSVPRTEKTNRDHKR